MRRNFAARLSPMLRQKWDEDDLAQTASIHALRCFARFGRHNLGRYWAWLRHICLNVLTRLARRFGQTKRDLRREELLEEVGLEDGSQHPCRHGQPSTEKVFEALETMGQLQAAIAHLPDDERRIVSLRFFEEMTFSQIANHIGLSIDAVKRACQRGMARLRRRLINAEERIRETGRQAGRLHRNASPG